MFTTFEERIEDAQGVMMLKEAKDKAEGRKEERERAIRSFLNLGIDESFLVKVGYTLEEIQKAKAKLNNLTQ